MENSHMLGKLFIAQEMPRILNLYNCFKRLKATLGKPGFLLYLYPEHDLKNVHNYLIYRRLEMSIDMEAARKGWMATAQQNLAHLETEKDPEAAATKLDTLARMLDLTGAHVVDLNPTRPETALRIVRNAIKISGADADVEFFIRLQPTRNVLTARPA